jgi:hypothetical protein
VQIVEATLAPVNSNHSAIACGVIRLVFNIIGCYLLTFCNRRTLTIASGVSSGLAMIALATHIYITATDPVDHWIWHYTPMGWFKKNYTPLKICENLSFQSSSCVST